MNRVVGSAGRGAAALELECSISDSGILLHCSFVRCAANLTIAGFLSWATDELVDTILRQISQMCTSVQVQPPLAVPPCAMNFSGE
jgi:hypothetical protein